MLKIHQPYIKSNKFRKTFAFASIGVLLLAIGILVASPAIHLSSSVSAAEIKYMQQFTNPICQGMSTGETMDLIDPRGESEEDFQTYTIVKLKDNRCWMQQNLKLNATSDTGLALTSNDTNITGNWTLPKTLVGSGTSVSGWTNDNTNPYSATFNNATYGTYYNWCAATAGTCAGATSGGQVASGSICPKGWHLPSGGGSGTSGTGEFGTLLNGLNMSTITASPYLFPAAGNVLNGKLSSASSYGGYWSRTAYSDTYVYYLYFNSSLFDPGTSGSPRYVGFSVRCVADPTVTESDFTYGDIEWSEDKTGDVTVNVPSILTIDAVSSFAETMPESHLLEGSISATVFSNTDYIVQLNAKEHVALTSTESTSTIDPVSSTNPVEAGKYNAWGFWDGKSNPKLYTVPLSTAMAAIPSEESAGENDSTVHTYHLGISITPSLPSGVYATDVIITASVK